MYQSSKEDKFDDLVVAELQLLRRGEKRLERLYSDLRRKPQLRAHFLRDLALLQMRADRLDGFLSPAGTAVSRWRPV